MLQIGQLFKLIFAQLLTELPNHSGKFFQGFELQNKEGEKIVEE